MHPALRAALALLATLPLAACGPMPERPAQRALYNDLRVVVETRQRIDWMVDRHEVAMARPEVLRSVCRVSPADRAALRSWIRGRIEAEGGPARLSWSGDPDDLDDLKERLTLERASLVLDAADAVAEEDCPFWMRPEDEFPGVQLAQGRLVFFGESMGGLQVLMQQDDTNVGAMAVGRFLPGFGISERLTLAAGVEAGVASTFPRGADGRRGVKPAFAAGVPVLLRVAAGSLRFDSEGALVGRAPDGALDALRPGVRFAQAVGVATLRIAGIAPHVMVFAALEYFPARGGEPEVGILRVGPRLGVDWDP